MIIALVPFKNEAHLIPLFMESLSTVTDLVIGYDDNSSDDSSTVFLKFGGILLPPDMLPSRKPGSGADVAVRQALLDFGRSCGGTHFLIIDIDEVICGLDHKVLRDIIANLAPGQYLNLDLLTSWQNFATYITGDDLRRPRTMDFAFGDESSLAYDKSSKFVHFDRLPRSSNAEFKRRVRINTPNIFVLHLSYINENIAQLKQSWYRMLERAIFGRSSNLINDTYHFTKIEPSQITKLPKNSLPGFLNDGQLVKLQNRNCKDTWHFAEICNLMERYPKYTFVNLDIFHVPEIEEAYKDIYKVFPRNTLWTKAFERWSLRWIHYKFLRSTEIIRKSK